MFNAICNIDNYLFDRVLSICNNPISPDCFFTSILIFSVGLLKSLFHFNVWNISVLSIGITSILHHSRLHTWYIQDNIRTLDNLAVITVGFIGFYKLNYKKLWIFITLYSCFIFYCILQDFIDVQYIPFVHSTTHLALIAITLVDDF